MRFPLDTRQDRKIAVVGLGYVGLPVAVAFGQRGPVVGFDIDPRRIEELQNRHDLTGEVSAEELARADVRYTSDPTVLRDCDFIIVAVPTPVDSANRPDLRLLALASRTVGENLTRGAIVVFESTVYPGATEEICVPVMEEISGLKSPADFAVGYSPERINPGDKEHTFTKIVKVVAGQTPEATRVIAAVYGAVVDAGIFEASSIKVAEAAKVIENTQRDLNIALMNELALIFRRIGIDSHDVLAAARTKWNFLPFSPGLVGGHCIGVDPYYLTHKAEQLGYHPQVILAGRRINDGMAEYIADQLVLHLVRKGKAVKGAPITVLGATFKENVPDLRNSGVIRMVRRLAAYGADIQLTDPVADAEEAMDEYGIALVPDSELRPSSAVVLAVAHRAYVEQGWQLPSRLLESGKGLVMDVRSVLDRSKKPNDIELWRM